MFVPLIRMTTEDEAGIEQFPRPIGSEDSAMASSIVGVASAAEATSVLQELKLQRECMTRMHEDQATFLQALKAMFDKVEGNVQTIADSVAAGDIDLDLDYQDSWPEVEVTIIMREILHFSLQTLTFDADFDVHLDWLDPKLKRDEHYYYNTERAQFEFTPICLAAAAHDRFMFNPVVHVLNTKESQSELCDNCSSLPQIIDEVDRNGKEVPWVSKSFHFCGTLECRQASALQFPFDVQGVRLRLQIPNMSGVTSLGQQRRVLVVEPVLRQQLLQCDVLRQVERGGKANCEYVTAVDYVTAGGEHIPIPMPHRWKKGEDGASTLDAGEMQALAIGGVSLPAKHEYHFYVILRRRWYPRYVFDILIMNLEVFVACMSIWVPFNPDMLANRLSISLAILLTIVAGVSSRPAAIDTVPYSSAYDVYAQVMVLFVIIVAIGNLLVFQNCWGSFRESGVDDLWDEEYKMVISNAKQNGFFPNSDWLCAPETYYTMGASRLDGIIFWVSTLGQIICILGTITRAQMCRYATILKIKHELDSPDASPGEYGHSKLIMVRDEFEFIGRHDEVGCAAYGAILPFAKAFWRLWACAIWTRKHLCCCLAHKFAVEFHPIDAHEKLVAATAEMEKKKANLPQISNFAVKISRNDVFRIMDVGSGEMGFYSYWVDQATTTVKCDGTASKFKYKKGATFMSMFLEDGTGLATMHSEIVERFKLQAASALRESAAGDGIPTAACVAATASLPGSVHLHGEQLEGEAPSPKPRPGLVRRASFEDGGPHSRQAHRKMKIMICFTGANRQMLRDDREGRDKLDDFLSRLNKTLDVYGLECIPYSPEDVDEAMYELWATEWVVQHGDLIVEGVTLDKAHRTLQDGRGDASTDWGEVQNTYSDLKAEYDLECAYREAGAPSANSRIMPSVTCDAFYKSFNSNEPLLRALLRARLFMGTMSAGSGSCQLTLRSKKEGESSQVYSLPVGNRTPLVTMKITSGHEATLFNKNRPATLKAAQALLCKNGLYSGVGTETQPAWPEDGPANQRSLELWSDLVTASVDELDLPTNCRGIFVGISAIFYAAKLAKCDGRLLMRDEFLASLKGKRDALMADGGQDGRGLSNLTLVIALVEACLHRSAQIVCKRSWTCDDQEFIATWTLGMYLKHSGLMGISLQKLMSQKTNTSLGS